MLFQCLLRSRIVTEHIAAIPTIAQECQIDRSLCPCRRIADPGNEPDIAFPACKQSHLPDLAARKHDRLVPNGRNGFNHIAGRIREQLFGIHAVTEERGGKNYSRGDLVAPGSLTQPLRTEGHRGKVGRSGQIPGKRQNRIVGSPGPANLQTANSFARQLVGKRPVQARRFVRTVKINHQLVFRSLFQRIFIEPHHLLRLVVEIVDLHTGDTRFPAFFQECLQAFGGLDSIDTPVVGIGFPHPYFNTQRG